jgi:hypothetical protein
MGHIRENRFGVSQDRVSAMHLHRRGLCLIFNLDVPISLSRSAAA